MVGGVNLVEPPEWHDLLPCASGEFVTGKLKELLKLFAPPLTPINESFTQLRYVEAYANDCECRSIAIESHYIDRDHMEDHSVFYSKSLFPYVNYCRRVHFFSVSVAEAQARLKEIVTKGIRNGVEQYHTECLNFSSSAYIGFAVIKPLGGSPVGRTVLKCFPEEPQELNNRRRFRRNFGCTRIYKAHFAGVELTVKGLAFQQQDVGVSACATTAIWTALQQTSNHEEITAATPAQITMLAAKYSLPFGRPMPSEGLSVDQMCQSVQALGVAPNLFRADDEAVARSYLYSAIKSGFAPVLILSNPAVGEHAVAVVGMKVKSAFDPSIVSEGINDAAGNMIGLYIHDDRRGPYLRTEFATLTETKASNKSDEICQKKRLNLLISSRRVSEKSEPETWQITHILIPLHPKIRLAYPGLRVLALRVVKEVLQLIETHQIPSDELPDPAITIDTWIVRAHKYVESLFLGVEDAVPDRITRLGTAISLARYIGIIRISAAYFDPIDIIVDTTSTRSNVQFLAVVMVREAQAPTNLISRYLAKILECELVE